MDSRTMIPEYEVKPHNGVSPVKLGMRRSQVRDLMEGLPDVFRKTPDGPEIDAWHESAFQVFYAPDETVQSIELCRGPLLARYNYLSVFEVKADKLIETLDAVTPYSRDNGELGYSYDWPSLGLWLWRSNIPSPGDDEGMLFDTIGIRVKE